MVKRLVTLFNKFHPLRITFSFLLILSITLLIVFLVDFGLCKYIEKEINNRITLLNGKAAVIKITLFNRTLKVNSLEWASTSDSSNLRQHSLRIKTLTAKGISLYELFVHNTIIFDRVIIDSGKFQFDRSSKSIIKKQDPLESPLFKFRSILLKSVEMQVTLDSAISFYAMLNCNFKDFSIEQKVPSHIDYGVKSIEGTATKISVSRNQGLYGFTIANVYFNTETSVITIDSTLVIPNFEKFEFTNSPRGPLGRITISIPHVTITGLDFRKLADTTWAASKIEITSFDLNYFKVGHSSIKASRNKLLPMTAFIKLPYSINVDTILVINSHIVYEEFSYVSKESGAISFNEINATLTDFNNRIGPGDRTFATMQASALLMNRGQIDATFQFPLDGAPDYRANGTVSNMSVALLNPILECAADIRVESGYLNKLTFTFRYNEHISKGLLNVDYKDLHVTILDKNKKSGNQVKTFVANVLVKANVDQTDITAQQSAIIDIKRDRTKSIFNVWSKSVLDGLKRSMLGGFVKKEKKKRTQAGRK